MATTTILKNNYKSYFSAMDLHFNDKPVSIDNIYFDTQSIDDGSTHAQSFVGKKSLVSDLCSIKIDNYFVNKFE